MSTTYPEFSESTAEFLNHGLTGCIYALDDQTVIKVQHEDADEDDIKSLAIEKRIFQRLKDPHPRIVRCLEIREEGIVMERLNVSLREFLSSTPPNTICLSRRLCWSVEAAQGLAYLHQQGILQADVSCTNILFDWDDHVKYVDFSGSSIDGEESLAFYCTRNVSPRHNNGNVTVELEIFAFGSVLYEIEMGHHPYPGLTNTEVEERYHARNFPEVRGSLFVGEIIQKCWNAVYVNMDEVLKDLWDLKLSDSCPEDRSLRESST